MSFLDQLTEGKVSEHPALKWAVWVICQAKAGETRRAAAVCESPELAEIMRQNLAMKYQNQEGVTWSVEVAPFAMLDHDLFAQTAEEAELGEACIRMLFATVRSARMRGKYGPYDWAKETPFNQICHAQDHIHALWRQDAQGHPAIEPDAAHAVTRLTIFQALQDRAAKAPKASGK